MSREPAGAGSGLSDSSLPLGRRLRLALLTIAAHLDVSRPEAIMQVATGCVLKYPFQRRLQARRSVRERTFQSRCRSVLSKRLLPDSPSRGRARAAISADLCESVCRRSQRFQLLREGEADL